MAEVIEYRAPRWWLYAGVVSVVLGPAAWMSGQATWITALVGFALGAGMVFVSWRTFVVIDDQGITWSPNGFRTFHADWKAIDAVHQRRVCFEGHRVVIPPLAGDPLARIVAEMEYRNPT